MDSPLKQVLEASETIQELLEEAERQKLLRRLEDILGIEHKPYISKYQNLIDYISGVIE